MDLWQGGPCGRTSIFSGGGGGGGGDEKNAVYVHANAWHSSTYIGWIWKGGFQKMPGANNICNRARACNVFSPRQRYPIPRMSKIKRMTQALVSGDQITDII